MQKDTLTNEKRRPEVLFRRTVNDVLRERDLPDLDDEEELDEEEAREIELGIPVNIFDYCHELMDKGEIVAYEISRNNTFLARKSHPYSWEQIQKEFGEGYYKVIAKSERTKKYLKQETRSVGVSNSNEPSIRDVIREAIPQEPKKDPFDEMTKMATLLKSLSPAPKEDRTPEVMMTFMQSMMSMQQESQKTTMTLIQEMQKSNQSMIERLDKSQREMVEKLENRMSEKSNKGFDPLQLLTLVQGAEKRGFQNYIMLEELAEKKAARMGGSGGSDDSDENDSPTTKLIKSVLPTVASALSRSANQPQQPVMPVRQPPSVPRQVVKPQIQPMNRPVVPQRQPNSVQQAQPVKPVTPTVLPATPKPQPKPIQEIKKDVDMSKDPVKQKILDNIMMPIAYKLMEAQNLEHDLVKLELNKKAAAKEVLEIVKKIGISRETLLQKIPESDMINIAKSNGLPEKANTWLKDFYGYIQEQSVQAKP